MEKAGAYRKGPIPGGDDALFALSPDPIAIVGLDGTILRANPAVTAITGFAESELSGTGFRRFTFPEDMPMVELALERLARGESPLLLESRFFTKAGQIRFYQWHAVRFDDVSVLVIGRDITQQQQGAETLHMVGNALGVQGQGYWVRDLIDGTAYWSPEVRDVFGLEGVQRCCGFDVPCEYLHPEDRERIQREMEQALADRTRETLVTEYRFIGPDKVERMTRVAIRICRDESGRPIRTLGTAQDVTAQHHMSARLAHTEKVLRAREHYFETLAKVAPVGIYQTDTEGFVVYANGRCAEIVGRTDVLGDAWESCVDPADRKDVVEAWNKAVREQRPYSMEYRFRRPDDSVVWVLSQAVIQHNEAGQVAGYTGTITDITALRNLTAQLSEAEARARRAIYLSFDIVFVITGDYRIQEINPQGVTLLGAKNSRWDDFMGRSILDLYPPEHHDAVAARVRQAIAEWQPVPVAECLLRRLDGSLIEVEGAAIPVPWRGESAAYLVYRDIGERKSAERRLRQRQHQFETLAKAAPVGIFQAGVNGECTYVNERYLEITGCSQAEALGQACWNQVVEEDRPELLRQWQQLAGQECRFERQYRLRRKDGQIIWVLGQAAPEIGEGGSVLGYIGSITDINQSKLNELELRNYREHLEDMVRERTLELEAVNRELESFSYSVSHDLRAPLRAINGFNTAFMEEYGDKLDDNARFFLRRIQANSRQMAELIDDLLELSKVTKAELHREWVDLTALAEAVLAELSLTDPERVIEPKIMENLRVFADPQLLHSLMQNLLGNAWKYTAKRPEAAIEIGALDTAAGQRTFFVRDNGVGFDMTCAQDLFRAFHRLHDSSQFEGTGIGLATVHRVVARHGGKVWAEAEEGRGATFFFVLH